MRLKIFFLFVLQITAKYGKVLNSKVEVAKYETDLKKTFKDKHFEASFKPDPIPTN